MLASVSDSVSVFMLSHTPAGHDTCPGADVASRLAAIAPTYVCNPTSQHVQLSPPVATRCQGHILAGGGVAQGPGVGRCLPLLHGRPSLLAQNKVKICWWTIAHGMGDATKAFAFVAGSCATAPLKPITDAQ
jgi:hypothetical protein